MLVFWLLASLNYIFSGALYVSFPNATSGTTLRTWNTLRYLVDDSDLLQRLYFQIAGVDEDFDDYSDLDTPALLVDQVVAFLQLHDPDAAALFPLHYALEPGFSMNTDNDNYFILNKKRFSSSEDLFYLKSVDLNAQKSIPSQQFLDSKDVVIGFNTEAPIVQFYGCDRLHGWESFNRNLLIESQAGKIRFIWRSTCPNDLPFQYEPSAIALTIKETHWGEPVDLALDVPGDFGSSNQHFHTHQIDGSKLSSLDMKVTALICDFHEKNKDFGKTLALLKQIVNSLPVLAVELSKLPANYDKLDEAIETSVEQGIDHTMLGLYVNGQYFKLSSLDKSTVIRSVTTELKHIDFLRNLLQTYQNLDDQASTIMAKKLLNNFSSRSSKTLQSSQPVKYDLHRVSGFSESVIYFNDIENDPEYKEKLKDDIGEFFKESEFSQLPAYRENWNEVIFVVNFSDLASKDTSEALQGLLRAVGVVKNGYPQRIGLLPMTTDPEDMGILRRIYELKNRDLRSVLEYLNELSISEGARESEFENIPPVLEILGSKLMIKSSSIIVNGEIYPFKSNLWNYIIAKVLKKDVSYIKDELRRINAVGVLNAREILHRRSFTERNSKYLPDYFEDASYFVSDVNTLKALGKRTIEVSRAESHNLLHTITIVDDFNTAFGLDRLINLMKIELLGVRLRAIHTGPNGKQWDRVRQFVSKFAFSELETVRSRSKANDATNVLEHNKLSQWFYRFPGEVAQTSFLTVNGRVIHFDLGEIPSTKHYEMILQREALRVLDAVEAIQEELPGFLDLAVNADFVEMASSIMTKMFYEGERLYNNGIDFTAEGSISRLCLGDFIDFSSYNSLQMSGETKKVDVTLLIDPLEERTQNLLTLISELNELDFVNLQLHLLPTKDLKIFPIYRIWKEGHTNITELDTMNFNADIDRPSYWHIGQQKDDEFELQYLVLEVNAFEATEVPSKGLVEGIGNVCLKLLDDGNEVLDTAFTSDTFGYGQFKLKRLGRGLRVESCSPDYKVSTFSLHANADYMPSKSFDVVSFSPVRIYVKLVKLIDDNRVEASHVVEESVNIFSIIEDREQENNFRNLVKWTLGTNPSLAVKFWIVLGEQPSVDFKPFLKFVSAQSGNKVTFEFLYYDWPRWLRPQRFLVQELSAAKILMLDLIFPAGVQKLIYMSPDTRVKDLKALWHFKFDSVFCLPRAYHSGGTPYWNEGYWKNFLAKHNLKFHAIEPAFIVDLAKYRKDHAGDKLRIHYQRLSAGINFLAKLDQDLINDMQVRVPISTLRKSLVARVPVSESPSEEFLDSFEQKYLAAKRATSKEDQKEPIVHDEL
ncbi:LANO_0C01816g1_1 [Lachancea nothofagi CBS 11611]|uniref:LANO_0C01816g1_1 n=1 Tax=Lachancea nothofagi CBS 11611 TaxID=1266666 RepID=A0A1G4J4N8_9SACH|nr:LANO_0C01816g1_1 [Lachancea nothofagi CBS 11611]